MAPKKKNDKKAAAAEKEPEKPAEPADADDADGGDDGGDDEVVDAKTLKNRKLREKKKLLAAAKKAAAGGGMWAGSTEEGGEGDAEAKPAEEAPAEEEAAASSGKKGAAKKAAAKKESAAVRMARERLEAAKKLEEERRIEEEKRKKEEEEERKRIEEEQREAEERAKQRRDAKAAKVARAKAAGTYLTQKEKEAKKRAEQLREMYGFVLDQVKEDEENAEGAGEGEAAPKKKSQAARNMPTKKKKPPQKPAEAWTEEEKKEEPAKKEEVKAEEPKAEAKGKAPAEEEDDDDDWEKAAEKIEEGENKAAAKDDDSDSGSDDSSSDEDSDSDSDSSDDFIGYRSPIICIMGHVDTGKTKLLDKIRHTNVQGGEAGGITQQIGATFFPDIALQEQTKKVEPDFEIEVPGLLIIDTPGHESFNNLRKRGSSLCDLAILVIDIMHGLENMTVESLKMLQKRRCPFIVALNKIDRLGTKWNSVADTDARSALANQDDFHRRHFDEQFKKVLLQLNAHGLNCSLWWENTDYRSTVSIVPTSAVTGEGVPDLLYMILHLGQTLMPGQLEIVEDFQCTVIEVKNIEGLGTTIDVILISGRLREGDQIVVAGMGGAIVTTIRALKTPQPMKEMRVKGDYKDHKEISMSMGIKICAPGLENAVAGTELYVVGPDDDLEELKDNVQEDVDSIIKDFQKQPEGVFVKASTLGSLEALLEFLREMKIPVFDVDIGEVHKLDVKKATIMKDKKHPEYAVILAFDVKVSAEARQQADKDGVQIMTADIIYHLFEKFTKYMDEVKEQTKKDTRSEAVFPVILKIDKGLVFRKQDPFIFGVDVIGGQLRPGTPICVPEKDYLEIGRVKSIEKDKGKPLQIAKRGDKVCVAIEPNTSQTSLLYGRHFTHEHQLVSKISRASIDMLKANFKDEMDKEDWQLVVSLKTVFKIE